MGGPSEVMTRVGAMRTAALGLAGRGSTWKVDYGMKLYHKRPTMAKAITADTARYCYLDFDLDDGRQKLANAAAFVHATNTRYSFSSNHLLQLGGSELSRLPDLWAIDHQWSSKAILTAPPKAGQRIVFQLDWEIAPLACENFATLCHNTVQSAPVGNSGKPLTYKQSKIHRILPGFIVQGGDYVMGNGAGGESVFGKKLFKDEKPGLQKKHDARGILSMGNSGKNSNSSQFFVTLGAAPQCNGKHVVFGRVISGWSVLEELEALGSECGEPKKSVIITDCGLYVHRQTPGAGFWYDQPDPDSYTGVSPVFYVRPRVGVVAPSLAAFDTFQKFLRHHTLVFVHGEQKDDTIPELLESQSVDVIVVAPACRNGIATSDAIVVAKPVEALHAIRMQSWLSQTSWQFDE